MSKKKIRRIELLAPAKNAEIGIEAIIHGADAVYIGAPKFGARAAAGNSLEEIEKLTAFASLYRARVYVALNTILEDKDLKEAEEMIWDLYRIGVDAVIVQDMGILSLNLPPIELHASTQTDNRTLTKVKELENAGFSQIVLARELTLEQISQICHSVQTPIEVFVHGALCVSYSGQCYISQAFHGRSANRGACAQLCRLPYDLVDADGKIIARDKHLLSMKDMNRADRLEELLDAGVISLKIEGRLKDMPYVKNIVAYYRKKLDAILERRADEFVAASSGKTELMFTPNPQKSFSRGFTDYFDINGKTPHYNFETPKSLGEPVGTIKFVEKGSIVVAGMVPLNNGDGFCFINDKGEFFGFRANRVDGNRIYLSPELKSIPFAKGARLYRNFDHEFDKLLTKKSAVRRIPLKITMSELPFGFSLDTEDSDGVRATLVFEEEKQTAQKPQRKNIEDQLSKLGNTIFEAESVSITFESEYFFPASKLGEWRRLLIEKHLETRKMTKPLSLRNLRLEKPAEDNKPFTGELSYLGNVANTAARKYYADRGYTKIDQAFELEAKEEVSLMFMKHCIKYALGYCAKDRNNKGKLNEPLYLVNKNSRLRLEFDCKQCEMRIYKDNEK
ncbi:MAG: peptidase U32 family protein [Bacteroidales bacterium]